MSAAGRRGQEDLGELERVAGPRIVLDVDLPRRGAAEAAAALDEEAARLPWAAHLDSCAAGPRALVLAPVRLPGAVARLALCDGDGGAERGGRGGGGSGGGGGLRLGACVTDQPGCGPAGAVRAGRAWLGWPAHPGLLPLAARGANLFLVPHCDAVGGDGVAAALAESRLPPRQVRPLSLSRRRRHRSWQRCPVYPRATGAAHPQA